MKFKYDLDSQYIISEDGGVCVKRAAVLPGEGTKFLLSVGKKKIGFQTAVRAEDTIYERDDGGVLVWHIGVLGCSVACGRGGGRQQDVTTIRKFESTEEQVKFLNLISEAMQVYDGHGRRSAEGKAKARVVFTPELRESLDQGAFLK